MKIVEPFRDKKQIDAMKAILSSGKMGQRNVLLFSIGINTAYRISDLRRLKLSDVLTISRDRVIAKDRLEMKEQKTGKHNSIIISNKLRKLIMEYCLEVFSYEVANRD
ncbi:site-specific integrase, partial [Enterococcus sp. S22(2020)]|nr:site-specific integrase [Enterococcus sp. S23]MCA5014594.1 site-specific integrase [Enterococcus sp. S23]MCA5017657.1 site-specific integrase [Enterococcus sp. S22(2020)]MCA5017847.1 site-specific integrase [Enterococcus sp. S22(2020)]